MDLILKQLGDLLLGSVPTIVFFVLLVLAYRILVETPLEKVLAERRARTSGALDQARGAMAAAEAETAVFEDKLRAAKNEIFQLREGRAKQWAGERERLLGEAKKATEQRVQTARAEIEQSMTGARTQVELMSNELSSRILTAVLPKGIQGQGAAQ